MSQPQIPKISEAEWEIMKIVWSHYEVTASDIISALEHREWSSKTIQTFIKRLVKKGALDYRKEGKIHIYFALVQEKECVRVETEHFIKRIYGGALQPLLVHFLKNEQLSKKEIEELKQILEQKGE